MLLRRQEVARSTLEHVKDVKVHTTYFLMWKLVLKIEFVSSRSPLFSLSNYCSATNNLSNPNSAASIVPITCLN
jgi:hypothetical protein